MARLSKRWLISAMNNMMNDGVSHYGTLYNLLRELGMDREAEAFAKKWEDK